MATFVGRLMLLVCLSGIVAAPVHAGGWATVRLDETPGPLALDTPWRFGFMVLQHDISPNSDVTPRLLAQHMETGEAIRGGAEQDGKVGHFVAELSLPRLGRWKFSITPLPFGETTLGTLEVVPESAQPPPIEAVDDGSGLLVEVRTGSCNALGDKVVPLAEESALAWSQVKSNDEVVVGSRLAQSVSTWTDALAISISDLIRDPHVARVQQATGVSRSPIACGEIGGVFIDDELTFGLQSPTAEHVLAIAVLGAADVGSVLTLFALDQQPALDSVVSVSIENAPSGDMVFSPAELTVDVGTTVVWTNETGQAHTVTGDDLSFESSALLDFGQTFRQTFERPGEYSYICGPHPWMQGTIVVE